MSFGPAPRFVGAVVEGRRCGWTGAGRRGWRSVIPVAVLKRGGTLLRAVDRLVGGAFHLDEPRVRESLWQRRGVQRGRKARMPFERILLLGFIRQDDGHGHGLVVGVHGTALDMDDIGVCIVPTQ